MDKSYYKIFFNVQKEHWWFSTKKNIVLDAIRIFCKNGFSKQKILDVGCGSGLMLNSLEVLGETYGMDMSDDAINFSREIYKGVVKKGSLPHSVPYESNSFTLVVALDVIEHIEDDVSALEAIKDTLVPGGKLIVTVPACMFLWSEHDDLNEHKRRYSLSELREKLTVAGFVVEKISYFNSFLFPIISLVRFSNKLFNRVSESDVALPSPFINYLLKKIFSAERFFLKFMNFPIGVSILAVAQKVGR